MTDMTADKRDDGDRPLIIVSPGRMFQDDARPGAMILGMDRTPKGRIWGCWTGTGDKGDGYMLLATSDDGGETWSKPRLAVGVMRVGQRLHGALVGNLWTDPKGRLWLFFDQQRGDPRGRITNWFIRCDNPDAGEPSWSEPTCFAEGCTLNKPIIISNGDWLLPVSDWQMKTARVFASADEGGSWKERGRLKFPGWEFDEHMMVELRDGRIWMLARTKDEPFESFSGDNGATWSEPRQAATVRNINSRFFLSRLRSGRILLVKNGSPSERLEQRSHMGAWLSDDEGRTWKGGLILDERCAVSYPDGFEAPDGLIHILYDWNRHTDAEILLAKFREEDVLAGKPVSADTRLRMLANKATGPKPDVIYNGIELPLPWPPPFRDPESDEPMPLPYFSWPHRPHVVAIDVGRQLFVDDFLVQESTLVRRFHQAEKFAGNPVFKPETERELGVAAHDEEGRQEAAVYLGHGGVFYDPAERLFKMFYTAGWRGPLSLAVSPDMKTWTRRGTILPEGLCWTASKLDRSGSDHCVWLDLDAKNPAERLKYLTCWSHAPRGLRPQSFSHSLHVSDGKNFSAGVQAGAIAGDYCSFFYNPFRKMWCFSIKQGNGRGRIRYYCENREFMKGADWAKAVYWTGADRLDCPEPEGSYHPAAHAHRCQLYSLNAVAYESLMIGMHYIHRGPENGLCDAAKIPKLTDLELGFSRDGFHWDRPDRRAFIACSRSEGSWDRAYLHSTAGVFVVLDDRLVFPYCGFSGVAPSGKRGMYTGASVGLATLRRDGFASLDAGDAPGTLTTRLIRFTGEFLFVNVSAAGGALTVEVLDEKSQPISEFSAADCVPIRADGTKVHVRWRNGDSLGRLAGKPVRFRFGLTRGQLYSFWVSRSREGQSGGYVAAGGPDFHGVRDSGPPYGEAW